MDLITSSCGMEDRLLVLLSKQPLINLACLREKKEHSVVHLQPPGVQAKQQRHHGWSTDCDLLLFKVRANSTGRGEL